MAELIWGWALVWLIWRLWLEWHVDQHWLPGSDDFREDHAGPVPPPLQMMDHEGRRLWRLRSRVTRWGFLAWVGLVALAVVKTLVHR